MSSITKLNRHSSLLTKTTAFKQKEVKLVENIHASSMFESACNLVQLNNYDSDSDTYHYNVIGNGCITIYLTDCNGNAESSYPYQCYNGNKLDVTGCHGCGC